jgi:hypothetical protein
MGSSVLLDRLACLEGTWLVKQSIPTFFGISAFKVIVKLSGPGKFSIDVNPSRWKHMNLWYFEWRDSHVFRVKDRHFGDLGLFGLEIGPRCTVVVNATVEPLGFTMTGSAEAGLGVFAARSSNSTITEFKVEKELKYPSWKFSANILCGMIAIVIGFQFYFGWDKNDFMEERKIPMDRPGEECSVQPRTSDHEEEDEFDSEDGY